MEVTCPKCGAKIDAVITDVSPHKFRWGSNDLQTLAGKCQEWLDPANAAAAARLSCSAMESAVVSALARKVLRAT